MIAGSGCGETQYIHKHTMSSKLKSANELDHGEESTGDSA